MKINPIANPITKTGVAHTFGHHQMNISTFHPPFFLYFRVSCGSITWTCMKEAYKGFSVYKDFIKDLVYLMLIVQALGGISVLLASSDWTFANTVSAIYKKCPISLVKIVLLCKTHFRWSILYKIFPKHFTADCAVPVHYTLGAYVSIKLDVVHIKSRFHIWL